MDIQDLARLLLSFRMELTQCAIIIFLHFKEMKAAEIHSKLVLCFGNDAYTLASVRH
jgi:hypothetical protein